MAALQMHGTGTPLGDPIEVGAACAVAADGAASWTPPLTLGATKARCTAFFVFL
jgi:acyl transferase domain-containing protein